MIKELNFELKYSRVSVIFQLFVGLGLAILLYQLLTPIWWLCAVILLFIGFIFFLKQAQISQIEYLDQKLWSVTYFSKKEIYRAEITKIIDYQLFVVIYLEETPTNIAIVWFDQLPIQQWKRLKVLEKLY
ncbi:hypothetical protein BDGL_002511 [Acinetobacter pittii PHEA-2]|uniref:Uncharacterized protein n=2 Tax=Acinetobacter pittii TaxID=48296 RepID=F0KQ02_ACIP2|nr:MULTISPECIES: hypothetical protein [Acinetobacter]YP_004996779.1 hypothetical protein BDGL_002511 [Acinetobacter pittii PHEA-2]ADY83097.1 hypothetical protein BDGL_002511 [Acinetobacter pittii PHEA-2]MCG5264047.1 hypothetical protein [Acinetobacter pittii]MCU4400749.1 hypothetical protein [Acinetobacter pittii]MCU4404113.1 hypothetical protein [Acinetobacter pittii]MCU4464419.1 hypothetical protein [Acinetobacter pittii]